MASSRFPRSAFGSRGHRAARAWAAVLLSIVAALHLLWAFTPWPCRSWDALTKTVVGTTGAHPGVLECLAVAALLFLAAALAAGLWGDLGIGRIGRLVVVAVLAVRGVGGFVLALLGANEIRPFRTLDVVLYSPFCLLVAALLLAGWWGDLWFGTHVRDVHTRAIGRNAERARQMLDTLGTANDRMWRTDLTPAMVMSDGPLHDSRGGHGVIRYRVTRYEPGRLVEYTFEPGLGLTGTHTMSIERDEGGSRGAGGASAAGGAAIVRHVLAGELSGSMRVLWWLLVQSLHDGVIEDTFDHVERECTGQAHRQRRTSWLMRAFGRRMARAEAAKTETPIRV